MNGNKHSALHDEWAYLYLYLYGTAHKLHYRDINGAGAWWLVVD